MKELAALIDNLPLPKLPEYFSVEDGQVVMLAWESARQQARPYDKEYVAPWLISPFDDDVWVTTNRNREEQIDGKWENVIRIDWRIPMPDGLLLTDPSYENLLNINKKIAFLVRSGYVSRISSPISWHAMVHVQIQLTRWVVLHKSRFQPHNFGFRLLDQDALEYLLMLLSRDGWIGAHQVIERVLSHLYQSVYGERCPEELHSRPFQLPSKIIDDFISWLNRHNCYTVIHCGVYTGKSYLKRETLGNLICHPGLKTCANLKFEAFCRQFEPDLWHDTLLTGAFQMTEKPSHKVMTFNEIIERGMASDTLKTQMKQLTIIFSAHRHEPEWLPEPEFLSFRRAENLAMRNTYFSSHHRFIPVNTGFAYLNEAMRFIEIYGRPLIDYYLYVVSTRTKLTTLEELNATALRVASKWKIANGEQLASVLNISGFYRKNRRTSFDKIRTEPTLQECIHVLVGACAIVMGMLKPSRENELTHLKRDCLWHNKQGYFIHFSLSKQNAGETLRQTHRPIPSIMAKAIHLLQHLGSNLSEIYQETRKVRDNLFYIPSYDGTPLPMAANSALINKNLNIFCDFVNLPADEYGRRWYARIHEMRKWFLLLLFWSGRYDVLDAVRWIAGHSRVTDTYAYIERECPGEELPQMEAEYSIERLRELEAHKQRQASNETGLDMLYERVLSYFGVESLTMVPECEWKDYVYTLRKAKGFHLVPHSVYASNGKDRIGINISFMISEEVL
ncbi:hypothetical protein ACVOPT_004369 [Enterobacter hormaechei]